MTQENFDALLWKVLSGDANAQEIGEFNSIVNNSEERRLEYEKFSVVWKNSQIKQKFNSQDVLYGRIVAEIRKGEIEETRNYLMGQRVWLKIVGIAASVAIIFSFIAIFFNRENNHSLSLVNQEMVYKINPAGQKSRVILPDGSVVWLNSDSKLSFLPDFSDTCRDIYLEGEAYFEVHKDLNRPFRVHTDNMIVIALGTAFNISAFNDAQAEMVALVQGKIGVTGFNNFYEEILPGHAITVIEKTKQIKKIKIKSDDIIAWKNGVLLLQDEDYHEAFKKLERWYGVNFIIKGDAPRDVQFFARFDDDETLDNVLLSMSFGRKFEYNIQGKQVIIDFNQK